MFRKVTRTGPATLTIAIPAKWARDHNLKPGEYLELTETENNLLLSPIIDKNPENIIIPYSEALIELMLEKLFLEAESMITIQSETEIPRNLAKLVDKFPGLQITEQETNKIIITRTLKPSITNPKSLLRRIYLVIKESLKQNPPIMPSKIDETFFLLDISQKKSKELFILKGIYQTLREQKEPIYDDAYALIKLIFNGLYKQKYSFSSTDTKKINKTFRRTKELFQNYFQKSKKAFQISEIHYCIKLLSQLHKEILYQQSLDILTKVTKHSTKRFKVGVCLKNQSNAFWATEVKGSMEEVARNYSDIEFVFDSPLTDFDIKEQEKILKKFIKEEVDGIIFAPVQPKKIKKTIDKINKLRIPLLILDTDIELEKNNYSFIGFDNYKGGQLTANHLKKYLKKKSKVLVIKGHLEGNFAQRVSGFKDVMKNDYKVDVIVGDFQESKAYENTLEFLKKKDVDAIFATSDNMALGAIKALEKLNKKVLVCGFDKTKEGVEALKQGKLLSSINTKPRELGALGVETMNQLLKKKAVAQRIEYQIELINPKNL